MSQQLWMNLLNDAITAYNAQSKNGRGGKKKAAELLGVSRTTVSLIVRGKYIASNEHVAKKVMAVFAKLHCPHLGVDISHSQCREHSNREAPTTSPRQMKFWRACQSCAHNQNEINRPSNPV